ncbi:MAG: MotA/TolQ/ExbB proton channel family protein, partial [Cyanobacteria bacterium]|nr:MotA/TolQ/ExbB proton channel family protein [Cyanobacteria bacterium CG_2015-16_32_12]
LSFGAFNNTFAQEDTAGDTTEMTMDSAMTDEVAVEEVTEEPVKEVVQEPEVVVDQSFHQILKTKFIEGGPEFMGIVLL